MGKFDGILICSDCDGTLTNSNGEISKENSDAIRYFQKEGGYFTVATGRNPTYFCKHLGHVVPNAPTICCNGIALYDLEKNQVIDQIVIENNYEDVKDIVIKELKSIKALYLGEIESDFQDVVPQKINDIAIFVSGEKIARTIIVMEENMLEENFKILYDKFADKYTVVKAWDFGIEVLPKNCSKAAMLPSLKALLKNINKTISIGDYDNDIELFKNVDIGYAVENAPQRVKDVADKIAPNHNNHAIAFVIKEIEKNL